MKYITRVVLLVVGLHFSVTTIAVEDVQLPSEVTLFKNMRIFDGTTDKLHEGLDILSVKNKIHKVAK